MDDYLNRSAARTLSDVIPRERVALAPYCTLGVGGPARYFVEAGDEATVLEALDWSRRRGLPVRILGGGSNLVIADAGVEALVVRIAVRGLAAVEKDGSVELTAAAGEPWDDVVAHAVARGWAGLECLSGIPGLVGATPMQNVGAYGQEVSDTVAAVRALDTTSGAIVGLTAAQCGFAYRDSAFKSREPGRYVVLSVAYRLRPGGVPAVRYADVEKDLIMSTLGRLNGNRTQAARALGVSVRTVRNRLRDYRIAS
jgi:UDP-N-acetylmuramate dehydrogenase